jgi:histidine ammonia-lyase
MSIYKIGPESWDLPEIQIALASKIALNEHAVSLIEKCRSYLDQKMADGTSTFYGINTGFGSLCNVRVEKNELHDLQRNLVLSHACGMGDEVPHHLVKLMLLLKIKNFTYGNSGVSLELVERLVAMYNHNMLPIIYTQGSLGASGDLAPLAHLSLPLLGQGEVFLDGERMGGAHANKKLGWKSFHLQSKEGLALLNGTQFMNAYALDSIIKANKLIDQSNQIAALSIDAFDASPQPFLMPIHLVRGHKGQIEIAGAITKILHGSAIFTRKKTQIQDPYSFRCIPQVHGASYEAIKNAEAVFLQEANSVTDNPLIFPDQDLIVSGGNFHGQILAIQLDFLKIALAELASISERRTYLLIGGQRELPHFLAQSPGLESGLMIAQYTAASIVSANKQLCTPASVDSIVSSNGQEDHVSMGANAATQLAQVVENVTSVLAIELLCATRAMRYRKDEKTSDVLMHLLEKINAVIDQNGGDVYTRKDIMACRQLLLESNFLIQY